MKQHRHDIRIEDPGRLAAELAAAFAALGRDAVVQRIWDRDPTVWRTEDREISSRLGWLSAPETARDSLPDLAAFAAAVRTAGLSRAVVLGMGGSSLAPEVLDRLFETPPGSLELDVLDTTDPETVAAAGARFDPERTLFLVSSKSGTTAEVSALLAYFYDRARRALGVDRAGSHFAAITDPGTPLETLARDLGFRRVFHGRPDIGGRFAALSAFGLVPAALKGIDLDRFLEPAVSAARACRIESATENPGAMLGVILGAAALKGMDKLILRLPPRFRPLAAWIEQLIAESTGKEGRGIVPVLEDRSGPDGVRGPDRLFLEIGPAEEPAGGPEGAAGAPLVRLAFDESYALAGQFFVWEFATAVAGHLLRINPFDQPDVESTKRKTREILAAGEAGAGPSDAGGRSFARGLRVLRPDPAASPDAALARFLSGRHDGDYLAVLAFVPRRPAVEDLLSRLAAVMRSKTGLPVTIGFGPRYLHSTGQLHKGDGNRGLFVLLLGSGLPEIPIPAVSGVPRPAEDFGRLFRAQAWGDALALEEKGRRVLALELAGPVETGLAALSSVLT